MSVATNKIKGRIKSVTGAYKVTSAMKLVSTVKLKKWKNKMLSNIEYVNGIKETTDLLLKYAKKKDKSPFIEINENTNKRLLIIISSTLGLCGAYNTNIFKVADISLTKDDDAIILGKKGIAHYCNGEATLIDGFDNYSSVDDKKMVNKLTSYVLKAYQDKKYASVHIIYSEYKNSLVFLAKSYKLLPLSVENKDEDVGYGPIIDPSSQKVMDKLIPFYLSSVFYSKLLESEVCEQASRSNAMENATNNAKDILQELTIEFNKARQASITQEIIEIVGASERV